MKKIDFEILRKTMYSYLGGGGEGAYSLSFSLSSLSH